MHPCKFWLLFAEPTASSFLKPFLNRLVCESCLSSHHQPFWLAHIGLGNLNTSSNQQIIKCFHAIGQSQPFQPGRVRTATEGKTCQLMALHRDGNNTQLTTLPASWHAFSCCRASVWFAMMIATGLTLSMDGTLRNPITFFVESEFACEDPWMPRPKEPPDEFLCWVVRCLLT